MLWLANEYEAPKKARWLQTYDVIYFTTSENKTTTSF